MTKVKTLADLKRLREELQDKIHVRESGDHPESIVQVKVAMATCGIASGAKDVMVFFMEELEKRGIDSVVTQTGCMGYCYAEPTIEVTLPGHAPLVFGFVDKRKADEIIEKYIKNGELVDGIIPITYQSINESQQEGQI
jgi:NADP-reducing hydrogenase subunit HndB